MENIKNTLLKYGIDKYMDILTYMNKITFPSDVSIESLYKSFEYEHDENFISKFQLQILEGMKSHNIIDIYRIIFPKVNPIRNEFVGVGSLIYKDYNNIGCNPKDVSKAIEKLQSLIDEYYTIQNTDILKPVIGFIMYLLYERVHPHEDGNGRMGRYIFFENVSLENSLFPLSILLNDTRTKADIFNEIFHYTNFPRKNVNPDTFNEYPSLDKYFDISFINEFLINRIIRVLYIAKIYKFLKIKFPTIPTYISCKLAYSNKSIKQLKRFNPDIIDFINDGFDVENHRSNLVKLSEAFMDIESKT